MRMSKQVRQRLSLVLAGLVGMLIVGILAILMTLFYNPTFFITPTNLTWALEKTHILEQWSWKSAAINHQWISWNRRRFYGGFQDLCLVYDNADINVDSCMEKISWNLELNWSMKSGFKYDISAPLVVNSSKLILTTKDNPEKTPAPDLPAYWDMLWNPLIPDLDLHFKKIYIVGPKKPISFDLILKKDPKNVIVEALGFSLHATTDKINIQAPEKVLLPFDLKTKNPLYFTELKLEAIIQKKDIPLTLSAKLATATIQFKTKILKDSLKDDLAAPGFLREVLLNTEGFLQIEKLKSTISDLARAPYNVLPAPINTMEGSLKFILKTANIKDNESVLIQVRTELEMKGVKQELQVALNSDVPFNANDKSIGAVSVGIELQKVNILLPQLSRTRLPPQFIPDSRFKNSIQVAHTNLNEKIAPEKVKKNPAKNLEVTTRLKALNENALRINTNLLDEVLAINFDLEISEGEIVRGYIHTLPFRTTIFKRKIYVQSVRIIFDAPLEPEIIANVQFDLPEYFITMELEGPISKPRQAFSSTPSLPIDDIYAVLLFGRPLSALDPDDKLAAKKTNQILSQGILSLGVLYYFAGSPVESLGYNPDSNELSASIGLGAKNSLRIGGSGTGLNSAGIRRSLGKGWYIDSSVQKSTAKNGTSSSDYGVLLERIISY